MWGQKGAFYACLFAQVHFTFKISTFLHVSQCCKVDMCNSCICTHFSLNLKLAMNVKRIVKLNCACSHLPHNHHSSYEYFILYQSVDSCAH